ncbi:MAG: YicC family protein [Candidatus Sumerlaeaceae bacterium]|nr:YicC family protein [Candidatus Sumerlaeaceae bacterium]
MIRSMTGYGTATVTHELGEFTAEVKSLNGRFLDVTVRMPKELAFAEMAVREEVKRRVRRGKVDVYLRWVPAPGAVPAAAINAHLLKHYLDSLYDAVGPEVAAAASPALLALPGVVANASPPPDGTRLQAAALDAVGAALRVLDESRAAEGAAHAAAILAHIEVLEHFRLEVALARNAAMDEQAARLRARVEELTRSLALQADPGRLEMEIALMADRCDITEELVRLDAHLAAFRAQCDPANPEPVGKTLDFLTQELQREVTTIGNKARGVPAAKRVVDMKAEIEKIREQVQNLE